MRTRLIGLICTIPLILIVIISMRFRKKIYDERDTIIDRKANGFGLVGAFIFMGGAGWFLSVITRMGSIKASVITLLVYIACFVWILVSSVAALIQYGRGGKEK